MTRDLLDAALEAARAAGQVLMEKLWTEQNVEIKGYRDVVTEADMAAEAVVLAMIRDRFPHHAILSEEDGATIGDGPYTWVVDPLDGTTNYAHGLPTFSVSVAVTRDGAPLVGVVYDPVRNHTFTAVRGEGAYLDGRPIGVSRRGALEDVIVALDWGHADEERADVLRRVNALAPHCRTLRTSGSAALAICTVGAGWVDVYFGPALKPWDVAASALIVAEAGGQTTRLDGRSWSIEEPGLLATNGRVHGAVLETWEETR